MRRIELLTGFLEVNSCQGPFFQSNIILDAENTLDETKDVVRTKLGLSDSTEIYLAQIRGEHTVDLDDGAFLVYAKSVLI